MRSEQLSGPADSCILNAKLWHMNSIGHRQCSEVFSMNTYIVAFKQNKTRQDNFNCGMLTKHYSRQMLPTPHSLWLFGTKTDLSRSQSAALVHRTGSHAA